MIMSDRQKDFVIIILLSLATLWLSLIRFPRTTPDSDKYLLLVEIFKGNVAPTEAISPFCYRPLLPLIISLFPTDPLLTWCVSSIIFNVALVPVVYYLVKEFGFGHLGALTGAGFTSISYMSVAVGSWVITDVAAMLFLALAFLAIKHRVNPSYIILLLIIGTLFKEFVILGAIVWFLYSITEPVKRSMVGSFIAILVTVDAYLIIRYLWEKVGVFNYMWGWNDFYNFTHQPDGVMLTFFVTLVFFVPVVIVSIIIGYKNKVPQFKNTLSWLFVCIPLLGYLGMGLFMAYFDVRFIWPFYLGMSPIVAIFGEWILPKFYGLIRFIFRLNKKQQ